ncbi:unnamed protein product [Mytilus edulis]|uniref:Uncharacterized protein n=1 Tax=Mytilus edulis TaxID=6550 RepID=A0A8S3PW41_MYTED|nr:unnamed protein product [Mytilus edulis]
MIPKNFKCLDLACTRLCIYTRDYNMEQRVNALNRKIKFVAHDEVLPKSSQELSDISVQWLLSSLKHSGFFELLKKSVKCVENSLNPGRHNPVTSHASPEELFGIHTYFKERPVSQLSHNIPPRTPKDADQFTYIDTRLDDILTLNEPSLLKREEFSDIVRVFSGDNPARQFKAGQQRGGNYSRLCGVHSKNHINFEACLKINLLDLEERRRLVLGGEVWLKFGNLKNAELIEELECRNVNTDNMDRNTLKDELTELMHGVTRPPALLMKDPRISTKT